MVAGAPQFLSLNLGSRPVQIRQRGLQSVLDRLSKFEECGLELVRFRDGEDDA